MSYTELKAEESRIKNELATCDDAEQAFNLRERLMIVREEMTWTWLAEDDLAEVA